MDIWFDTGFFGELEIKVEVEPGFNKSHQAISEMRKTLIDMGEFFIIDVIQIQPYEFKSKSEYESK